MRWWIVMAAAGCTSGAATDATPVFTPDVPTGDWPSDWASFEEEVLHLVNLERFVGGSCGGERFGASDPLEMDEILQGVARTFSAQMADQGFFEHVDPQGRGPEDRVADASFPGAFPIGENIAEGYPTPTDVMDGWMASPGHCSNILEPAFHVVGIGYYFDDADSFGHFWTQDFAGSH